MIIVNWRQPELTARAVESVLAQRTTFPVETVIVENEGTAESAEALRARFPEAVVVLNTANEGFAGGVTSGIAAASGEVLVLLNNDAVALPGFLEAGVTRLVDGPARVAAVAARVVLEGRFAPDPAGPLRGVDGARWAPADDGEELLNSTGVVLTRSGNCYDRDWLRPVAAAEPDAGAQPGTDARPHAGADTAASPFAFTGGAVFLRASAVAALGGFDTRYFMYYEDVDLSWRLRLAGHEIVYEPGASVRHRHAGSSDHDSPLIRSYSMRNRTLTMLKNAPLGAALAVVLRSAARAALDLGPRRGDPYLDRAGWRLYAGSLRRFGPAILRGRRATSARERRRVFGLYAEAG